MRLARAIPTAITVLTLATSLAALIASAAPAPAKLEWPDTEIAVHARAWFAQMTGTEEEARRFFTEHFAPSALAEAGVDTRLERRRGAIARSGGLTPLAIERSAPAELGVRCNAGNGDVVIAWFEGEPASPHRLLGVRLEAMGGGPGGGPPPAPTGPALADTAAARLLRQHLDASLESGVFSGAALLARGGRVIEQGGWGLADRSAKTPITTSTRFNLASIGKLFTRTAIAQLASAGKLSLDDKLSKYLPDYPHADSITIGMLCAHRAGVGDIFGPAYDAMDRSKLRHNRDYIPLFRNEPLWFAPGTSQRYSNGGYVLLGEVIAKVSGEDYYDYLAKHVYAPAGMTATSAPIEGDGTPGLAHGYTRKGAAAGAERDNVVTRPARGSAAGGSYSTLADLLAFDRALFSGRLCPAPWAAWVAGAPEPGPGVVADPGPPMAAFAGGAPGISTEWTHEGDVTLIVLTNRDPDLTRVVLEPLHDIVRRMGGPARP